MLEFKDRVAIVTGAGQGIGFEIAKSLVDQGANVVVNDLDLSLAQRAVEQWQDLPGKCIASGGDISTPIYIKGLVEETVKVYGRVDYIIANAGITLFGDFLTYSPEDLNRVLQVNLMGSFLLAQAGANQMVQQGEGGRIIFMSSVTGHQAHVGLAAYGMTKAGLEMLAKALVVELAPHRITVNTVAPGATLTERTLTDPEYARIWSGLTPMGRAATTEDIAGSVLFFLSSKAGHITGQNLIVDGGWTAVSPNPPS